MNFDFIIAGGGSAGCVLANRLSEDPRNRVLLLEAGGSHHHFLLDMPLGFLRALRQPRFTSMLMSEPEPHLDGRRIPLPRGRVLGGSSSINGMFYMRGHRRDYDGWRQSGCEGWSFADVLPYFKRMETSWRGAGPWHGGDGPLHVVPVATRRLLHEPLMASAEAAGFSRTDDLSAERQEGFARGELTIDAKGRRASAARAYLDEAIRRPNLTVIQGARARRILLEGRQARGIEFAREGKIEQAFAAREVILAGGTYNSPQLLMLSGIGPARHLRQCGIEPVADMPGLGQNLSEHPRVPVQFGLTRPVSFLNELRADKVARWVTQWKLFGSGAFASQLNSCNIVIRSRDELERPDIQLFSNPVRMDAEIWFPLLKPRQRDIVTADVILLHPRSRGWVELASPDPNAPMCITLNNFADPEDLRTARDGIRIARRIYRTAPQAELTGEEVLPGAGCQSDDDLDVHIRATAQVTQHPVGTCSMGHGPQSVVDPQLRVHGFQNLRIVDASIMPDVPGANTNAPTIMIAEKAADMILGRSPLPAEDPADDHQA